MVQRQVRSQAPRLANDADFLNGDWGDERGLLDLLGIRAISSQNEAVHVIRARGVFSCPRTPNCQSPTAKPLRFDRVPTGKHDFSAHSGNRPPVSVLVLV